MNADAALCSRLHIPRARAQALLDWVEEVDRMREALGDKGWGAARVSIEASTSYWVGRQITLVVSLGSCGIHKTIRGGDPWTLASEAWSYISALPHGDALAREFEGQLVGPRGVPL